MNHFKWPQREVAKNVLKLIGAKITQRKRMCSIKESPSVKAVGLKSEVGSPTEELGRIRRFLREKVGKFKLPDINESFEQVLPT